MSDPLLRPTEDRTTRGLRLFDEAFAMLNAGTYKSSYETEMIERFREARALITGETQTCTACGEEAYDLDHGWCADCIAHEMKIMHGSL